MLKLSDAAYREVRRHGEETYPHECCGVLLGLSLDGVQQGVNKVEAVVRAGNTRTDSAHNRYQISPHELVRIQREARQRELDIIGFYHSHPDHPARWSLTDFAEAHWLGCSYVITSVEDGKAVLTNSFFLAGSDERDKKFEDEEIQLELPVAGT
jgi:proteasome lid subunit RPN8/RPN11